jgi:3-methyladenine DNA glycosylase AlkD
MLANLGKELAACGSKKQKEALQWFFKTGKGEYGEGDVFLGVKVPHVRQIAKKHKDIPLSDVKKLLDSKIHEERQAGLFILVQKFQKGSQKEIYEFYMKNIHAANNWDLVDLSAHKIAGAYLFDKDKKILYDFARSKNLWKKRVAVISTFYFIGKNEFADSLRIAEILLHDKHDLIHKAVGWMLREIGKRDLSAEEAFLKKHYKKMPRTMLRYAIEKFDEKKRHAYLKGEI